MTRRSCSIYATVIVALIVVVALVVGIALAGAQVFQTMIHERLKKVSSCLYIRWSMSCSLLPHFYTLSQFRGFSFLLQTLH